MILAALFIYPLFTEFATVCGVKDEIFQLFNVISVPGSMNPTRNIFSCSEHSLASVVTFTDLSPVKYSA